MTTITSLMTLTGQTTSTNYSTFAIATTTQTSTTTTTVAWTFSLPALTSNHCYETDTNGTFKRGDKLVGTMTSSSVINFYVMSKDQYDKMGVRCVIDISNALVRATNVDSYSLNWVVPSDGEYYFVFYNFAVAGERGAVTGSFTLQFPTSQLVTSTLQSTVSNEITFPTETIASTYSSTIMMPFQWVGNNLPYVIVGVIVIAGVLAGAVIMGTKRTSKPPKSKVKVAKREAKAKTDVQFCINCGAELPLKSEFCNKCGSAQK